MTILIPSYEPDDRLIALIHDLREATDDSILVVDDGSGEDYRDIFDTVKDAGCTVLTHPTNQGKGLALKTGFDYVRRQGHEDEVICADSDGQHLPDDILKIKKALHEYPNHIVLGCRRFTGKVPLRSRLGNSATRMVYSLTTGTPLTDTQTGLRGYSSNMLDWLCQLPGDRFEYEMNMLLEAPNAGYCFKEVPIDTVYLDDNKSSHFRPIIDSAKVYFPFMKFCASSGFAAIMDFVLLLLFLHWTNANLLVSVIGARFFSSVMNFMVNRGLIFGKRKEVSLRKALPLYYALVLIVVLLNYGLMHLLNEIMGVHLVAAKFITEASLFLFSYWAQRKFIY
ncbi:bifunctional glycosyltransferase family 2/GtrA family protein [Paenibacillus sp. BC26]|uniref:bifunctional glycosyltransferase family 2/GtrA family protein n=1 Tax=Paenibacillus sp. BC26 TaxID=1881032 RepID=UPI0008F44F00|nr:bifunctional glycosyltransferase family 2/GtrA family protein [Paenibacillus sp. BC26]SFT23635.1 Putative flippase GtrA (transmembrane translocase of bactoprenol-linked glucose) [Paenibacillus sp. BC26]